jgi:hypothetical protein
VKKIRSADGTIIAVETTTGTRTVIRTGEQGAL